MGIQQTNTRSSISNFSRLYHSVFCSAGVMVGSDGSSGAAPDRPSITRIRKKLEHLTQYRSVDIFGEAVCRFIGPRSLHQVDYLLPDLRLYP